MKVDNLSFLYALGNIGDDLVVEAEKYTSSESRDKYFSTLFSKRNSRSAACFVVVFMMTVINRMNIDLPIDETLTTDSRRMETIIPVIRV